MMRLLLRLTLMGVGLGSVLNGMPTTWVRQVFETRALSSILNILPDDPFSADLERDETREQVDQRGPWAQSYQVVASSSGGEPVAAAAEISHNKNYHHIWYFGHSMFRNETAPEFLWAAQGWDEQRSVPVIVGQRATLPNERLEDLVPAWTMASSVQNESLVATSLLRSDAKRVVAVPDPAATVGQRNAEVYNYVVVEDDAEMIRKWWPLSRVLAENVVEVLSADIFTSMTNEVETRDASATYNQGCGGGDYRPPAELDAAVSAVLELYLQAITAALLRVRALHAAGLQHCALNFDSFLVENTADFLDLFLNKTVAAPGFDLASGAQLPEVPAFQLRLRFLANLSNQPCRNQLAKNTHEYAEFSKIAMRSFERSTIPDAHVRLHHDDNVSLLREVLNFAVLIGVHVSGITRDHIHQLDSAHRLNLFRQFTEATLSHTDSSTGATRPTAALSDADLIDWFEITQQILRPQQPNTGRVGGTHVLSVPPDSGLYRPRAEDLEFIEGIVKYSSVWPWPQEELRKEFSLAEAYAASLYMRRFVNYKTRYIPDLVLDPWFELPPYWERYATEEESFYSQFVYGGHSLIAKGYFTTPDAAGDAQGDGATRGFYSHYCSHQRPEDGAQLVIKVALPNPRYALSCYNRMLRNDVRGHRRCTEALDKVNGLVVTHYVPPREFEHLAITYEELLNGPNVRDGIMTLVEKMRNIIDDDQRKVYTKSYFRILAMVIDRAADFWGAGYIHQDMSLSNIVVYPENAFMRCSLELDDAACSAVHIKWVDWGWVIAATPVRAEKLCQDCITLANDITQISTIMKQLRTVPEHFSQLDKELEGFRKVNFNEAVVEARKIADLLRTF